MYDGEGNHEAQYWIARNRIRTKFGLSAAEADAEPSYEADIHMYIWNLITERKIFEAEKAERRAGIQSQRRA